MIKLNTDCLWYRGTMLRSGSWWWTGKPGVLQSTGSERVRYCWATELNWLKVKWDYKGGVFPHARTEEKPYENTAKRRPSASQKESPQKKTNPAGPCSWTFQFPELWANKFLLLSWVRHSFICDEPSINNDFEDWLHEWGRWYLKGSIPSTDHILPLSVANC